MPAAEHYSGGPDPMRGLIIIALSVVLQGCAGLGLGSSTDLLDLERQAQHAGAWYNLMQLQAQELTLTAMEARRYLDRKNPRAQPALERAEQLIEVFDAHAPTRSE